MAPRKPSAKAISNPTNYSSTKSASNPIKARKANAEKPLKQIFKGFSFSFSGSFGDGWAHEDMARWIKTHGGEYEAEVSEDTTHLICTIEDYKKKTQQVKKAWALGRQCNIVVRDWLEDCLSHDEKKKRARAEKGYTLDQVLKRVNQSHKARQRYRESFEDGVRACNELADHRLHRIHYDADGFEYKIICTRINNSGRVKTEKYTIYLFESIAKPPTFMVGAKLTSPGRPAALWRDECKPKCFDVAFRDFQAFFFRITGIAWDDRCDGLLHNENKFKYHAPLLGRPVGALPAGKSPLGFPKDDKEETEMTEVIEGLIYDTDSEVEDKYDSSSPKSSGSVISISSSASTRSGSDATSSLESFSNLSLTEHYHTPQILFPNNTIRLPKPFRSGLGMPAYDRHFVNIEKRYTLPRPSLQTNRNSTFEFSNIKKNTLMIEGRFKRLTMWNEKTTLTFAQKAMGLLRKGLGLKTKVADGEKVPNACGF